MKHKWMLLTGLVLAMAVPAVAQSEAPKVEITGQYSYLRFNPTLPAINNRSFNGGGPSFSFFLRPSFGIKADLLFYGSTTFTTTFGNVNTRVGFIPAGVYSTNGNMQNYLFGPIVKFRKRRFEPFGEILFGVAHTNTYANLSRVIARTPGSTLVVQGGQSPFAMAVGGGVDVPVSRVIAIRVGDVDYLLTRMTNPFTLTNNQNNFRYSGGVQFRFGGAK
jgi:hypothetical protein